MVAKRKRSGSVVEKRERKRRTSCHTRIGFTDQNIRFIFGSLQRKAPPTENRSSSSLLFLLFLLFLFWLLLLLLLLLAVAVAVVPIVNLFKGV